MSIDFLKPTLYLDHNILSLAVNWGPAKFISQIGKEYQVIYTDETLKEIKKSLGYESRFLEVLEALNARYFIAPPQGSELNQQKPIFLDWTPQNAYNQTFTGVPIFREIEHTLELIPFRLMHSKFLDNNDLPLIMDSFAKKVTSTVARAITINPKNPSDVTKFAREMENLYAEAKLFHERLMETLAAPPGIPDAVTKLRALIEARPVELNNIAPPNVISKIWKAISSRHESEFESVTLDEFFLQSPNQTTQSSILGALLTLNICGYNSDRLDRTKENRASMSDISHACNASLANNFMTTDRRLSAKTKAVYEYLGLRTVVHLVSPESLKADN